MIPPMFSTLLGIVGRTLVIYVVTLIGIRLSGKREVGQMTPFDLVVLLLLANAVQNAMTGPDTSLQGGVVAAATLLIANNVVARLAERSRRVRTVLEGTPRLLIRSGRVLQQNLLEERVTVEELHQALREHGIASAEDVALAVLEIDGTISVLKKDELPTSSRPHHRVRLRRKS